MRQWNTYQLIAAVIARLAATQKLSQRTQRLLMYLERSIDGTGIYLVLCKLEKMILSLDRQACEPASARLLCRNYTKLVNRVMSRLDRSTATRVQAAYSAAVLSVTVRQLLRRSALDVATL